MASADETRLMGAGSGAASGAVAGTMIAPGIGTAVGAVAGGLLGFMQGDQAAKAQEEAERAQRRAQEEVYRMKVQEMNSQIQADSLANAQAKSRFSVATPENMSQMGGVSGNQSSSVQGSLTSGTF